MEVLLTALSDPARWRLVGLLAERPRPVGVLAQLAGARQPQTTKHLQTLERAGIVSSQRSGQRRIYSLRSAPLRELAAALSALADTAEAVGGARETFDRYGLSVQTERLAAEDAGWADGRTFLFHRSLAGRPELVWRHLTEPSLLTDWWTPDDLRVSELVFEARPGGRIVVEYRDVEDADGSDVVVGRADGVVDDVLPGEHLAYRSSPTLPNGSVAFTSHVDLGPPADGQRDRPGGALPDHRQHRRLRGLHRRHRARLRTEPRQARGGRRRGNRPHQHKEYDVTQQTGGRRVVTNLALSLDGRYAKPDNALDMSWVMPYAVTDVARDHLTSLWEPATTACSGG